MEMGSTVHIDPRVFLSRPQDLSLEGAVPLDEFLISSAYGADKIVILSAYYGTGYLESVFGALPKKARRACSLTLVFGVETLERIPAAVETLRAFRKRLIVLGFPTPAIRIFNKNAPFHTKLYYFKRTTQPIWFIGSANASPAIGGARHELMLRLSGRHEALSEYMDSVIDHSIVVEEVRPKSLIVRDIRSFLLNGALCYRPLSRVSFTFEACQINRDHRAVLKESLAAASKVPHADPQTEGFGFSLVNAVRQITGGQFTALTETEVEAGRSMSRIKFRHKAVETIYGYWLPATYARDVREKLRAIEAKSVNDMKKFAGKLESVQPEQLYAELERHITGLKAFFYTHSVNIEPKLDYRLRFSNFIRARILWLTDEARLEQIVRRLHVEPMPDIWGDEEAAQRFEDSFFEDLAMRFDAPEKSRVVSVLNEELALAEVPGPEGLKVALAERLKQGFPDSIWGGEEENNDFDHVE